MLYFIKWQQIVKNAHFFLLALKSLEASGLNVTMEDVANTDHFSIIEQLVDGEYQLTKVHTHKTQQKERS